MANTGYKIYTTRKEVLLDPSTGQPGTIETGLTESNVNDDDYVSKVQDLTNCPVTSTTSFMMSYIPTNTSHTAACSDQSAGTYYHDGSNAYPVSGDYVYTNSAGTTAFNGQSKYYKVLTATTRWAYITSSGYVSSNGTC